MIKHMEYHTCGGAIQHGYLDAEKDCRQKAEEMEHAFFFYRPDTGQCGTGAECKIALPAIHPWVLKHKDGRRWREYHTSHYVPCLQESGEDAPSCKRLKPVQRMSKTCVIA